MTTGNGGGPPVTSLDHVLERWATTHDQYPDAMADLRAALLNREDAMAEVMFLAGMQFGLFPQIVAEVLAEVGLGTPKTSEEREMIRRSFVNLMEAVRRAQSGEGPMPTP